MNKVCERFQSNLNRGGDQSLFVTKELFDNMGGFNKNFCIMEEFEFMDRTKAQFGYYLIAKNVIVSSRKYSHNSYLRVNWANYLAYSRYRKKVSPAEIKQRYYRYLNKVK